MTLNGAETPTSSSKYNSNEKSSGPRKAMGEEHLVPPTVFLFLRF